MKIKIDKVRYFECGKQAPPNSAFKGKMTGEMLSGYSEYTGRDDAKEHDQELVEDEGYFNYTSSHHTSYTRTSEGILDNDEKRTEFQKLIKKYFHSDGDLAWENVLSIADFDEAEKIGLYSIEDWEAALNKALPKFFKYAGFEPENTLWWWDLHVNKFHPHVHIIWLEKEKTKLEGYLPPKQLKALKRFTALELEARKKLVDMIDMKYEEFFKQKDVKFKTILMSVDNFLSGHIEKDIMKLYRMLPKTGRLQYNSYHMKEYKPYIDKIIENIILSKPEIKSAYDDWLKNIDLLEENMNDIQNSEIATFKEAEIDKLYSRIGNKILKNYVKIKENDSLNRKTDKSKNVARKHLNKKRYSSMNSQKVLGAYIMSCINKQEQEMEESLREFLRINDLRIL